MLLCLGGATCHGDVDWNGVVNPGDRGIISANIGQIDYELICLFDLDGNGVINPADRGIISANIGLCSPLPDWQNGMGLGFNGETDTRFGGACAVCGNGNCQGDFGEN